MPMPILSRDLSRLSLDEIAALAASMRHPPVDLWNPPLSGHSQIRIARNGSWFHDGTEIRRETMVRLFATILRREADGSYVLVTPAEKQSVEVDDMPFQAVEVKSEGNGQNRTLAFRLNIGDLIVAGEEHPLSFEGTSDIAEPSLHIRGGLEARITRPVFYELAEMALTEENDPLGIWSNGTFFSMAAIA